MSASWQQIFQLASGQMVPPMPDVPVVEEGGESISDNDELKQPGSILTRRKCIVSDAAVSPFELSSPQTVVRCDNQTAILTFISVENLTTEPIGRYRRDFDPLVGNALAVNAEYITYTVRGNLIRVISQESGLNVLIKGHEHKVIDMKMSSVDSVMASVDAKGSLYLWKLSQKDDVAPTFQVVFHAKDPAEPNSLPVRRIAMHPNNKDIICLVSGRALRIWDCRERSDSAHEDIKASHVLQSPSIVSNAAFSPDGSLLAAACADGRVILFDWKSKEITGQWMAHPHGNFMHVSWFTLKSLEKKAHLLLTSGQGSSGTCKQLRLWGRWRAAGGAWSAWCLLSDVELDTHAWPSEPFCHQVEVDPSGSFVVVNYIGRKSNDSAGDHGFLVLHIRQPSQGVSPDVKQARFDYISRFPAVSPILSFLPLNVKDESKGSVETDQISLFCVHTHPIQQYHISASQCWTPVPSDTLEEAEPVLQPQSSCLALPEGGAREEAGEKRGQDDQKEKDEVSQGQEVDDMAVQSGEAKAYSKPEEDASETPKQVSSAEGETAHSQPEQKEDDTQSEHNEPGAAEISGKEESENGGLEELEESDEQNDEEEEDEEDEAKGQEFLSEEAPGDDNPPPMEPADRPSEQDAEQDRSEDHSPSFPKLAEGKSHAEVGAMAKATAGLSELSFQVIPEGKNGDAPAADLTSVATTSAARPEESSNAPSPKERKEATLLAKLDQLFLRHHRGLATLVERERQKRLAEEKTRMEGLLRGISHTINTVFPAHIDRTIHKHMSLTLAPAISQALARELAPSLERVIQQSVQDRVGDFDRDFANSLKAPMQEAFAAGFQKVLLPSFEASTRAMFQQIHATMQQAMKTPPASSTVDSSYKSQLEAQRAALASLAQQVNKLERSLEDMKQAQAASQAQFLGQLTSQIQQLRVVSPASVSIEEQKPQDVKSEIRDLMLREEFDSAFYCALTTGDLSLLLWLCSELDPEVLLTTKVEAHKLTAPVSLSLLQQLGYDLTTETETKLSWIRELLMALQPSDPLVAAHVPVIFREILTHLNDYLLSSPGQQASSSARLVKHLLEAQLR